MTTTARGVVNFAPIDDPHQKFIAFAANPTLKIYEKAVGEPSEEVGEINTTTMHSDNWVTKAFKTLKTMGEFTVTGAYTGGTREELRALIGVNGWITVHDQEGGTLDFPGGLKRVEYSDSEPEGTDQPTVTLTIVPTMQIAGVETDPEYTPPAT